MLRNLPSVTELLESPPLKSLVNNISRGAVVAGVGQFLDDLRLRVQTAAASVPIPAPAELAQRIADWIATGQRSAIGPVINATGIIAHGELGGAPLADEAVTSISAAAQGYVNLELDLASGEPAGRLQAVEAQLTSLTRAEAATVVNNHAAATLLTLAAVAGKREVIVSRGQLVDAGGGNRLLEIALASGATLREVGATNNTRLDDYAIAIGDKTAAILHVHTSDYSVIGSAVQTPLAEVMSLGRKHTLPVIDDLGSGGLIDLTRYGIAALPTASASISQGADLVLLSGDKLLGGPQCGIILGRRALVQKIARHPLARALSIDKLTLAGLAATLRLYQTPELTERSIPLLSLLATPLQNLRHRAERLAPQIAAANIAAVEVISAQSSVLGNSLPNQAMPTVCLALTPKSGSVDELAAKLRRSTPPIIGRIEQGRLLLDLRSVPPREDLPLVSAIADLRGPAPEAEAAIHQDLAPQGAPT